MPINDPNYRLEYVIAEEAWWRDATRTGPVQDDNAEETR